MKKSLYVVDLGMMRYKEAWDLQKQTVAAQKTDSIPDVLFFVEHPPVVTLGTKDKWSQLHVSPEELRDMGVDFYQTDRDGGVTYHGPGQLVGYPILDLSEMRGSGLRVRNYFRYLDEVVLATVRRFGVNADIHDELNPDTRKPYRAIWYLDKGKKRILYTKGIRIKNRVTCHGFTLYVNEGESHFDVMDPCGFDPTEVSPITMEKILGESVPMGQVKDSLTEEFKRVFEYSSVEKKTKDEVFA